ncbi:MAG: cupin domain-containing protein [Spongiibacteraceae bacterium]
MTINNFDIDEFLQHYWQKKPLLIRNAFPDFDNPISAEELAGLACEEQVESRLIKGNNNDGYELANGPLEESIFKSLPETEWTLLVQAVDHYSPEVAALLNHFRFIPNWRIDDVMVSYATTGGSVGPHFDNYDVFLLQGAGTRRWQLGKTYDSQSARQKNDQLLLLADFETQQEWILEPGDMLYIPPQISHWGIAEDDDCMTYSVGFRAPSQSEILADFCDHQIAQLTEDSRYTDTELTPQQNPGEIHMDVILSVQQLLRSHIGNTANIAEWFGRFMTQPKYFDEDHLDDQFTEQEIADFLEQNEEMYRDGAARFAFSQLDNQTLFYANGLSYPCKSSQSKAFAELLAATDSYSCAEVKKLISDNESFTLLETLLNQGSVYFDEELFD